MIFCGDVFQIPPIGSDPVYRDPETRQKVPSTLDLEGYELWRKVENVVILEESMRHNEDHEFAQCLQKVRRGVFRPEEVRMLNTRVMRKALMPEYAKCKQGMTSMVVSGNELRQALNWKSVALMAARLQRKPIVCVAEMNASRARWFPSPDIAMLLQTAENETNNLPALLPMLPGMPIGITQNVAVELCLANGTEGTLLGVKFPVGTKFEEATCFGVECLVATKPPLVAFITAPIVGSILPLQFESVPMGLPEHTIPIVPYQFANFTAVLRGKRKLLVGNGMSMRQRPFVPAFAVTTYKVQGVTADGVLSFPFLSGCPGRPSFAAMYVVLSRVRKLSSLFLVERISEKDMAYFVPPTCLLDEDKRLKDLHLGTLGRTSVTTTTWDAYRVAKCTS